VLGALGGVVLVELVHAELAFRLEAGEPARVEEYLERFPELTVDSAVVADLLRAEYEGRRRREPGLDIAEYGQRFPDHQDTVKGLGEGGVTSRDLVPPAPDLAATLPTDGAVLVPDGSTLDRELMPRPPEPSVPLPLVPGYAILSELGRGGMGVVFKARQLSLNRVVALKMIQGGGLASGEEQRRFRAEAEAVARLQHPNVVQVHEVGEHNGRPFFSLEFCPGGSLDRKLAGTPLPPEEAARLAEALARAVDVAHRKGVIHRDLKPANVLLGEGGVPKVTDFGLAKFLDDDSGRTRPGQVMGTPSYMAPEQAEGRTNEIGPATDVYALGAILYELLTGRPPFKGVSAVETMNQVTSAEPVPPSRLQPKVPRDLETICLHCLHKQPPRRYGTALSLAEDLGRFLAGEPIQARPVGVLERAVKWVQRRPTAAALWAVSLLALLGLATGGLWYRARVRETEAATRALVESLKGADTASVPRMVDDLEPYRRWADPLLVEMVQEPGSDKEHMHAALALLPVDPDQVNYLRQCLLRADLQDLPVLRDALRDRPAVGAQLWAVLEDSHATEAARFRAGLALAAYAPPGDRDCVRRWQPHARFLTHQMLAAALANPSHYAVLLQGLRPLRSVLLDKLKQVFRAAKRPESERRLVTLVLADYAADRPDWLAELVKDASPEQYAVLFPRLVGHGEAVSSMRAELLRTAPAGATEVARDDLARRQAQAAVTLLRLGHTEEVWPLLRHRPDPRLRSYLIHFLSPLLVNPQVLVDRLANEGDVSARRALLLALGEFDRARLAPETRQALEAKLLQDYRTNPDPGTHSATDWVLRQRWGRAADLEKIDRQLAGQPARGRHWYVNKQGQTLAVIGGPVEFFMGSPNDEPQRYDNETLHRRPIDHRFALCTTHVTVAQFERFKKAHPAVKHFFPKRFSPAEDGPVIGVTWYEAAQYCNWLSATEGIPPEQWCYPSFEELEQAKKGKPVKLAVDYLRRSGYRLPTEAEWEYACRAGSVTSRFYGHAEEMLTHYAWYVQNAGDCTWPVGGLKPNDFGLFDIQGNVWDWTNDQYGD
jgi:formylglycine-generating enzyme required for sulfatase activity